MAKEKEEAASTNGAPPAAEIIPAAIQPPSLQPATEEIAPPAQPPATSTISAGAKPVEALPDRDSEGRLTLDGMRRVIARGGSVIHTDVRSHGKGHVSYHPRVVTSHADLPSIVASSKDNTALREQERQRLIREQAAISEQLAALA